MAARHLPAHNFVCLTDRPGELPGVDCRQIAWDRSLAGWWAKLRLFDPAVGLAGRCLYFDLDVLLLAGAGAVAEFEAPFAIVPDGGSAFRPRGYQVVKRFNSSVMAWDAGQYGALWADWSPGQARRLWGDQDWIGERLPAAATMPLAWFPRLSTPRESWGPEAKVVLCKKPKNAVAAARWPWFAELWQ
jgi:hypothetical protein